MNIKIKPTNIFFVIYIKRNYIKTIVNFEIFLKNYSQILIIGAGPAGTTASMFLTKQKIYHTLIDKAVFPRDKICGDALSGKVFSVLKKLENGIQNKIYSDENYLGSFGVKFFSPSGLSVDVPFTNDIKSLSVAPGFIATRKHFDNFLLENSVGEYANVIQECEAKQITKQPDGKFKISCINNGQTIEFVPEIVLAADGDRSIFAKQFGGKMVEENHYCAGLRVYYKNVSGFNNNNFIELHFIKKVLPGYFWVFPMSNGKANVGIGLLKKYASKNTINLRKELEDIIQNHPEISKRFSGAEPLETPKGWGLPLGSKRRKISGERFMLLGDAGSLIDPFTGEGIANAMICGMHAANVIELALEKKDYSSDLFYEYDKRVYNRLGKEFSISTTLQKLSRFPWLFNFVVKKAIKNKTFRETLTAMFNDLDLRSSFKDPKFYWRIFKN
jgi:geranylgeranyl reductase family protein